MRPNLVLLVLFSVLLSASSQVLLKFGMTAPSMQASLASRQGPVALALAIGKSPVILAGLTCFGFSAVVWLFVLARIPLSSAYPFVALGIVITVVAGHLLFAEQISLVKIVGVASILAGIGLVAISR